MVGKRMRTGSRTQRLAHAANVRRVRWRAARGIARAARGSGPIVVGPWLGEVGVELLFWIPFLNWFRERYEVPRERLVAISRGGAAGWYADVAGRYVDVFEHFEVERLREWVDLRLERTGAQKQTGLEQADREVLLAARSEVGESFNLLHPSEMYWLFADYWTWQRATASPARVLEHLRYRPLPRPDRGPDLAGLPERYVAVKAYFNRVFPDDESNRDFLGRLIERLRARGEVVTLETGIELDDHPDYAGVGGLHSVAGLMTPATNLDLQTRVIAHAEAIFATHGGFSYLGPYLGVNSYSFYSRDAFIPTHRDLMFRAQRALREQGVEAANAHLPVSAAGVLEGLADGAASPVTLR